MMTSEGGDGRGRSVMAATRTETPVATVPVGSKSTRVTMASVMRVRLRRVGLDLARYSRRLNERSTEVVTADWVSEEPYRCPSMELPSSATPPEYGRDALRNCMVSGRACWLSPTLMWPLVDLFRRFGGGSGG